MPDSENCFYLIRFTGFQLLISFDRFVFLLGDLSPLCELPLCELVPPSHNDKSVGAHKIHFYIACFCGYCPFKLVQSRGVCERLCYGTCM